MFEVPWAAIRHGTFRFASARLYPRILPINDGKRVATTAEAA
jgi:hypothetical protein